MIIAVIIFLYLILGTVAVAYADHTDDYNVPQDGMILVVTLWPFLLIYVITRYLLEENKKIKNKKE